MNFSVQVVRELSRFADQEDEWDRLARSFQRPLLAHDWLLSCAEAFAPDGDLCIVTVRRDGHLAAAAPLQVSRHGHLQHLEMLGAAQLYEPTGFIYEDENALRALCDALVQIRIPLWLHRLPADEPISAAMSVAARRHGWLKQSSAGESAFLSCSGTWSDYLQSRSSQRRYDLRRARRRLESEGRVSVERHTPAHEAVEAMLEVMFAVEGAGWKGREGSAINTRPQIRDFLMRYATRAARVGSLQLCLLKIDSRPVAVQIVVAADERHWVLKIGYDEKWARASPGLQLLTECMRSAIEEGTRSYEFLGTAEPWILPWASGTRPYLSVRYYPRSVRGALGWAIEVLLEAYKGLMRASPAPRANAAVR